MIVIHADKIRNCPLYSSHISRHREHHIHPLSTFFSCSSQPINPSLTFLAATGFRDFVDSHRDSLMFLLPTPPPSSLATSTRSIAAGSGNIAEGESMMGISAISWLGLGRASLVMGASASSHVPAVSWKSSRLRSSSVRLCPATKDLTSKAVVDTFPASKFLNLGKRSGLGPLRRLGSRWLPGDVRASAGCSLVVCSGMMGFWTGKGPLSPTQRKLKVVRLDWKLNR